MGLIGDVAPTPPQRRLLQAALVSLACHAMALALFPGLRGAAPRPALPSPLEVRLAPLPANVAAPAAAVEPRPEATPAVESKQPPPVRRTPVRIAASAPPTPVRSEPVEPKPIEPAIDRTAAEPEPVQAFAPAPAAVPEPPPAIRADADMEPVDSLMQGYGRLLEHALGANQHYPRIARQRGWQGLVKMRVQFLPGGQVGQVSILSSSGFPVLDETALDMVRTADLPRAPDRLRSREFTVDVPVLFRLRG
ncbi:MAG: TonB family protein [Proteobacteria bacterium]|nr:TonB family protein [Pseudomonadota bacterium]MBS1172711.1 TonB family protein [Pseudomonadota bacterium]